VRSRLELPCMRRPTCAGRLLEGRRAVVASPNSTAETAPNLPRPRVLWVGESARLYTGFGRVADELTRGLAATGRYELGVLGWQAEPENGVGYTAFPAGREPWSADRLNSTA